MSSAPVLVCVDARRDRLLWEGVMRLILTTSDSGGGSLKQAGISDLVIPFGPRFVGGPLSPEAELASLLATRPARDASVTANWLGAIDRRHRQEIEAKGLDFIVFCATCERVELWVDPEPNAQLILIWLLSCFRGHDAPSNLGLVQAHVAIGNKAPEELAKWVPDPVAITSDHIETASRAWRAWCAPTPQPWFELLGCDLSPLPQLRPAVLALLEELPWVASGLGATEMRLLELIDALIDEGAAHPGDLFPGHRKINERRVYDYWAIGELLDRLAHSPSPAVRGLDEGPFTLEMHDNPARHRRYQQSTLALTRLGQAILAGRDDFSAHNPINRRWGGTELRNDRLWRWDRAKGALVAP